MIDLCFILARYSQHLHKYICLYQIRHIQQISIKLYTTHANSHGYLTTCCQSFRPERLLLHSFLISHDSLIPHNSCSHLDSIYFWWSQVSNHYIPRDLDNYPIRHTFMEEKPMFHSPKYFYPPKSNREQHFTSLFEHHMHKQSIRLCATYNGEQYRPSHFLIQV